MSDAPAELRPQPEPTARIDRSGDGCVAVVEVDVPGTAEEVWESVATGPGYRRWFVEAELEPRVGGALVTHHGDFGDSEGTITAWDPPRRYAYVEPDWMGDGTPVPDWTTEITLEPVPDDGPPATRVRLASGVGTEGERWGEDMEATLPGWTSALRLLAEFHTHFAGRDTAQALVMREAPAGHRLTVLLGLDGAVVGQTATARAAAGGRHAEVTGTVIEVTGGAAGEGPTKQDSVVLRVPDDGGAAPGVYEFGTMQYGETRMSVVRGYLYLPAGSEPGAGDEARRTERVWSGVLDALLQEEDKEPGMPTPPIASPEKSAMYEDLSPLAFLGRSAAVFPEREAVVYGGRRSTYREFAEEVQRLARALKARIAPGQTVTVIAPNIPQMLMAHFAVPLAGGVLSALNPRLTPREIAYILEHSEAAVVFADGDVAAQVREVVAGLPTDPLVVEILDAEAGHTAPTDGGILTYDAFLAQGPEGGDLPWRVADEDAPITLNYTSGTTGPPKGVLYTHRGAYLAAQGEVFHNGYTGTTRYLWTLPMFHCNGWCMPWAVTSAGGTHVCLRAVRQEPIWDAFEHEGVTHLSGAPIVCAMIVESERAHTLDRGIRMTTAGAAPPPSVIEALESLNITPVHVYGLTESYGPFTICEPQESWAQLPAAERARLMARQGVPMVHAAQVAIMDPELNILPADGEAMGEVVLRGNGVMKEYFKNPEATAESFRGGWYHTGDLGVMHPDGYIQLMDRLKDIIISGGENISSIEVEGVLHAHPKVADAAVVGVADDKWGERPIAFVVTEPGAEVTPDELRSLCKEHLAGFKVPDRVKFVDELPRTATGKIRKNSLRALQGDGA